jgi:kinesin family protein 18/19
MIANISPSILNIEETMNTLKYANRAKNIKVNVKKNIIQDMNVSNFDHIIEGLKSEIENLRHQLAVKTHNNLLNSIFIVIFRKN